MFLNISSYVFYYTISIFLNTSRKGKGKSFNILFVYIYINMHICIYIQGDYKKTLPTSALLAPVLFNRSRWNFKYSYLKVCARDSVNGNTVVLTVTVIVSETRKCLMATPTFFCLKMFSACEKFKWRNGTDSQGALRNNAYDKDKTLLNDSTYWRKENLHWHQTFSTWLTSQAITNCMRETVDNTAERNIVRWMVPISRRIESYKFDNACRLHR